MSEKIDFNLDSYRLNLSSVLKNPQENKIEFILPGLPIGETGLLLGTSGIGKSFYSMLVSLQISTAFNFNIGIDSFHTTRAKKVLYLSFEEKLDVLSYRINCIREHWSEEACQLDWEIASQNLSFFCLGGLGLTLIDINAEPTKFYYSMITKAKSLHPKLIIIDTLRSSHDSDENDNGLMAKVIRVFNNMAKECEAAVLILHHENKSSALHDSESVGVGASRGASSIIDSVRCVTRLQFMHKNFVTNRKLSLSERNSWIYCSMEKVNYSERYPSFWLKRLKDGILVKSDPSSSFKKSEEKLKTNLYEWR